MSKLKALDVNEISDSDIIIAVMGPTGVGKSTFIDMATKQNGANVGHHLKSETAKVRAVRITHPQHPDRKLVIVDTPGFDDTYLTDTQVLSMIADWLQKTYKNSVRLTGIIYMHRISDNRMGGSPLKNLNMFQKLCGESTMKNVILATTMWGKVDAVVADRREAELHGKYWKPMLNSGSKATRFYLTYDSAWSVIDILVQIPEKVHALLLQKEMVDLKLHLCQTQAGTTLYDLLQKLLAQQQETSRKLLEEAQGQNNPELVKALQQEYNENQQLLRKTFDQVRELKIPLGRRLLSFLTFWRRL